ncbi:nickel-responsive regulator [Variibacter gotjawalensis]|uniref:Putative nickel-responsive regulator n=1 Tax=Variibacter gotjawalensis TaxID=1333996 RepID=A0A0S3PRM7_9BRAD|nr:nickel-responsive transcriptional regulator NikR [Variibacter gotjawalensis]NIK48925.1 CopG family nickel-responsive transcriptional regulator [Variibacter gotjawalensis]RZS50781.1 CopG family transcriptional regulator [Variibacter gotjawalensis]BAT58615.1 nickel-responsive regulator [Variibacter gotjawalensis]
MHRVTITIDEDLAKEIDAFVADRQYANRSEAMRDLARAGLKQAQPSLTGKTQCVATLAYTYDHHARDLPQRIVQTFHDHHDIAQATLHVHLDHHTCLEVAVLRGKATDVQSAADKIIAERGVRYGTLMMFPKTQ